MKKEKNDEKRYLEPGETIRLNFYGRVGPSGTIIDVHAEATEMINSSGNDHTRTETGNSIGTIDRDGNSSDIFIEVDTGRLWHNEDDGWY